MCRTGDEEEEIVSTVDGALRVADFVSWNDRHPVVLTNE